MTKIKNNMNLQYLLGVNLFGQLRLVEIVSINL
jgi:hypothetical protein